jgi:nucleotide-binding universal stress UspA family protein
MNQIVIGTEDSPDAATAVEHGLELAHGLDASVTFVCARVVPNALLGDALYRREFAAEVARARDVVREAMAKAAAAGVHADYEILDGSPADAILNVAETHDADLIVVGSRGLGPVQSAIFGSVSKEVVTRSPLPVLVVKKSGDKPQRDVALVDDRAILGG